MNKVIPAGIGIGIALIALAVMLSVPGETDQMQDESPSGVQLSDEIQVVAEETKSSLSDCWYNFSGSGGNSKVMTELMDAVGKMGKNIKEMKEEFDHMREMIKNRPVFMSVPGSHFEGFSSAISKFAVASWNIAKFAANCAIRIMNSTPPLYMIIAIILVVKLSSSRGNVMPDFKPREPNAKFKFGTELCSQRNSLFDFLADEISHTET